MEIIFEKLHYKFSGSSKLFYGNRLHFVISLSVTKLCLLTVRDHYVNKSVIMTIADSKFIYSRNNSPIFFSSLLHDFSINNVYLFLIC